MTNSNSLDALFAENLTKDQFIAKYNDLKFQEEGKDETSSIFKTDCASSMGAIFDVVDVKHDGKIDEEDIKALKNMDNSDGENVLSDSDITKLYEKALSNVTAQYKSNDPKEMYSGAVDNNGVKPTVVGESSATAYLSQLSNQISMIEQMIQSRKTSSESKVKRFEMELDSLIVRESNLTEKEKNDYLKITKQIEDKKKAVSEKEEELRESQSEAADAKNEISFLKSMNKDDENNDKINEWTEKYNSAQNKCNTLQNEIASLNSEINGLNQKKQTLIDKATSDKKDITAEKKRIQDAIKEEELACNNDITQYKTQLSTLESAKEYAIGQAAASSVSSNYSDSDTTEFSGDAQDLKAIWSKSHPNLSDGFYNKVCEIAKRIGCDANALMAVMNSESGLKSTAVNKSSGATGLIQFMPSTAKGMGTSTAALRQMSPEQQLVYVEKFLIRNKKMAGFGENEKLQQGQLYALVFLPAYAKREVLTVAGHKFYNSNKGLDMNKDGQITISDLNARVEQMKKKA